jgi:hypothetical protein
MSVVFKPIGILSGVVAGLLGKKTFQLVWGLIDDQDPPEPKYRRLALGKLALASAATLAWLRRPTSSGPINPS